MSPQRACWCGHADLGDYSADYRVCRACGTLVTTAPLSGSDTHADFYSERYWHARQTQHHGLPDIVQRARLDLPERCTHWLRHLLERRARPARILDVGCAHGAYLALLGWAGYEATGTEMSASIVEFARRTFGVNAHVGTVESLALPEKSFDVIVLNDVLEHLPDPLQTMEACARLLRDDGFFVIQTPEYKEHLGYADLKSTGDLFLKHMDGNNEEHLFLFSRRSAETLFRRLGLPVLAFSNPVYSYDLFFTASRTPLPPRSPDEIAAGLAETPSGRLVQALLDKAFESTDRWWAIQRLEGRLRKSAE